MEVVKSADVESRHSGEVINAETESVLSAINSQRANRFARLAQSRTGRLSIMLSMTTAFFFVEIIVGYTSNSLSLVADSFHMLSDIISLSIGLYAVRVAKRSAFGQHTFGFVRAEVLGALVNAVFLLALVFSIIVEAISRFFEVNEIKHTTLLLWVGGVGLFINLVGLALFASGHGHGHSHGGDHGHGHGHGHGGSKKTNKNDDHDHTLLENGAHTHDEEAHAHAHDGEGAADHSKKRRRWRLFGHGHSHGDSHGDSHGHSHGDSHGHGHGHGEKRKKKEEASTTHDDHADEVRRAPKDKMSGSNMRGVFLHILGDALGSVVVIIGALVVNLTDWSGRFYVDPALSLLISFILASSAIPLVRSTAQVLLQYAPMSVDVDALRTAILNTPGVIDCHELHIWSLSDNKIIASVHVTCSNTSEQMSLGKMLKDLFHRFDIHSVTIQQEFPPRGSTVVDGTACFLTCNTVECNENACCPVPKEKIGSVSFALRNEEIDHVVVGESSSPRHHESLV